MLTGITHFWKPQPTLAERVWACKPAVNRNVLVAGQAMAELSVSYGLHLAVGTAVAMTASMHVVVALSGMVFMSLVVDLLKIAISAEVSGKSRLLRAEQRLEAAAVGTQKFARFSFMTLLGAAGPITAVHESGHALFGLLLLKNTKTTISISPFRGGYVEFGPNARLGLVGRLIGLNPTRAIIYAAGIIATTLVACAIMACANRCRESRPILSQHLELAGFAMTLPDILYGIDGAFTEAAQDAENLGDFHGIQQITGCHPLFLVAAMITAVIAACGCAPGQQKPPPPTWTQRATRKIRSIVNTAFGR